MSDGTSNPIAAKLRSTPKCRCMAWSPSECCCQVDWPEHFIKKAADEIDRLTKREAELVAENNSMRWQLTDLGQRLATAEGRADELSRALKEQP